MIGRFDNGLSNRLGGQKGASSEVSHVRWVRRQIVLVEAMLGVPHQSDCMEGSIEMKKGDKTDKCPIHKVPLMSNGKCSVCVYARFGAQLRNIV